MSVVGAVLIHRHSHGQASDGVAGSLHIPKRSTNAGRDSPHTILPCARKDDLCHWTPARFCTRAAHGCPGMGSKISTVLSLEGSFYPLCSLRLLYTAMQDLKDARTQYSRLVRRLISNGTTTAMIFGSLHLEPSMLLADTLHQVWSAAVLHDPHPAMIPVNQDSIIAAVLEAPKHMHGGALQYGCRGLCQQSNAVLLRAAPASCLGRAQRHLLHQSLACWAGCCPDDFKLMLTVSGAGGVSRVGVYPGL